MSAPSWSPTPADVGGLVSDRALVAGTFTDADGDDPGTLPTLSWVTARIETVAARVTHLASTPAREAIAGEYVLYTVAADVDSGWTAGRKMDQYSRSLEYRKQAAVLFAQLVDGDASSGGDLPAGAGLPAYSFPDATMSDSEVW